MKFKHLIDVDRSYPDHFWFAFTRSFILLWAAFTSIVHAVWPDLFPFVADRIVRDIADGARARREEKGVHIG